MLPPQMTIGRRATHSVILLQPQSFSELQSGKNLQNILGDLTPPCSSPLQIPALPTPTLAYWWPLAPLSLATISWMGPASLRAPSAHGARTKLEHRQQLAKSSKPHRPRVMP